MKIDASDGWRKQLIRVALLLCLLSFCLMVWSGYDFITNNTEEKIMEKAKGEANETAQNASKKISSELNTTCFLAEGIASDLSSGELEINDSVVERRLRKEIKDNPSILSIAVAYSPAYYRELHSLHFKREGSGVSNSPVLYNYTDSNVKSAVWYTNAMKNGFGEWNEPYFGVAANTHLLVYSVPFYLAEFKNGSEAAGVVAVSHSLEGIRTQVGNLGIGNTTGYGFIISSKGVIISYPAREYLFGNIQELAEKDKTLNRTVENIGRNVTDRLVESPRTKESSWVFYENISSRNLTANWILGVVLPKQETLLDKEIEQKHSIIQIVLAAFAFFFSLCLLLVSFLRYGDKNLWLLAFVFSFLCLLGIGVILHLTLNISPHNGINGDNVVFNMAEVETVLQQSKTSPNASRIPTGVFIQSLEFSSAYNVMVTGYIWQNISNTSADYTSPSFSFPESESEEDSIEKAYEDQDKGVVGWRFKTTFRQEFDYSRYPYDREDVWIKIWNNASSGSILVPDFDSYDSLNPADLPGLERSLVLEGWEPQRTYFSYRVNSYNTNFGVGDFKHSNVPELYYNFDIKRDFKSPFASYILPVMVVAILLFAVLMITTKDEKKEQCGFSSSDVLGYCSALFFVLIIAHASLRDTIPMDGIIYLECFYFIMYLAILAVSLNSIAFASSTNFPFIDTKDNLYVKVMYWPVVMGIMLLITLINFY